MSILIQNARVVIPDRIADGLCLRIDGGRIKEIAANLRPGADEKVMAADGAYLAPGFIDLHMHVGYLGIPWADEFNLCARQLPANGTTRYLPTLISALKGNLPEIFEAIRDFTKSEPPGAQPFGAHLEGPYVAVEARGGFLPEQITTPERFSIKPILDADGGLIRLLMVSPELPGIIDVIRLCVDRGIVVALGHTFGGETEYVETPERPERPHCTHTYNNRRSFPESPLETEAFNLDDLAVVDDEVTCELICDGTHVKPVWVKTIYRAKGCDKICLITDSFLAGRRSAEGETFQASGGQPLVVRNGVGRDAKGGLAGSVLTQDQAVKNFIRIAGATLPEAVRCASLNPARVLGVQKDFGSIDVGKMADIVLLDEELTPWLTLVGGRKAFEGKARIS